MKAFHPANIIHKPSFQFTYLGILGIVVFLLLRTSFDFNSGARINHTGQEAQLMLHEVNAQLGFESDTLSGMAQRFQDGSLYSKIQAESPAVITPLQLNRSNVPITGWTVVIGSTYKQPDMIRGVDYLFEQMGSTRVALNNQGRVVSYTNHPDRNYTFLEGAADYTRLTEIIEQVFGYELLHYQPDSSPPQLHTLEALSARMFMVAPELPASGELILNKTSPSAPGPTSIKIAYSSIQNGEPTEGFAIESFDVFYTSELAENDEQPFVLWDVTMRFVTLVIIIIVILGTAIRQIFRGRMEWKRSLIIFGSVTLAQLFWQVTYLFPTYYAFFDSDIILIDSLQQLLIASFYGIYASFAYVAWESLARELKSGQIPVIDAVWNGNFMKTQVGAGILTGYGIAGVYFVIIALMFYSYQILMFQSDSTLLGFREPSSLFPAGNIFLNAWLSSMLFVIAQVGVAYNLIAFVFHRDSIRMLITMAIAGGSLFLIGPFFASDGSTLQVLSIYIVLSIPLVLAYRYFGIVSAIISWFVLLMGIRMLPYVGSESAYIAGQGWLLLLILLVPFVFGLVSVFYGKNLEAVKKYIPEYEEKLNKRMRSEKELAIAKESQSALMPATPPKVEGLDIHGFFVPSHEVGGDFYDFTVIHDTNGGQKALALAIVDVSGKAMQSAFNAIFTSGLLLSRIQTDSPAAVLTQVNPILCDKTDDQTFITCQIGHINLHNKELILANAGHCPPLLKRNGSCSFIPLSVPRFPLGFRKEITYNNSSIALESGDVLFFYSDGLPEAQSQEGKRLDFESIKNYFKTLETNSRSAAQISMEIKQYILEFSNYELADDTTLLCVKIN